MWPEGARALSPGLWSDRLTLALATTRSRATLKSKYFFLNLSAILKFSFIMGRMIILSGPSCVGKGPLHTAFKNFYPKQAGKLKKLVLYNCRSPRPGEIDGEDYHFRSREEIEKLRGVKGFVVLDVRGDLQAVDLLETEQIMDTGDLFFEGNPFVGRKLLESFASKASILSIFLAPLSKEEITFLQSRKPGLSLEDFLTDVMRRKLLRRTTRQKNILSLKDLENIERRAKSAYTELQEAWAFDHVIPNHDGEDSENWDAFYYPIGDARKALLAFAGLIEGPVSPLVEKWERGLFS
jgi:guanylate kinase